MIIRTKGIFHERTEDAPFIGALVCAVACNINCIGCFNQALKDFPTIEIDSQQIINEILDNPFNKGIILAGLEWTLQPVEMIGLICLAKINGLNVMLYTGLIEEEFKDQFAAIYNMPDIYIKFGCYDEKLKCEDNVKYNVRLSSSNQKIIKTKGGILL